MLVLSVAWSTLVGLPFLVFAWKQRNEAVRELHRRVPLLAVDDTSLWLRGPAAGMRPVPREAIAEFVLVGERRSENPPDLRIVSQTGPSLTVPVPHGRLWPSERLEAVRRWHAEPWPQFRDETAAELGLIKTVTRRDRLTIRALAVDTPVADRVPLARALHWPMPIALVMAIGFIAMGFTRILPDRKPGVFPAVFATGWVAFSVLMLGLILWMIVRAVRQPLVSVSTRHLFYFRSVIKRWRPRAIPRAAIREVAVDLVAPMPSVTLRCEEPVEPLVDLDLTNCGTPPVVVAERIRVWLGQNDETDPAVIESA